MYMGGYLFKVCTLLPKNEIKAQGHTPVMLFVVSIRIYLAGKERIKAKDLQHAECCFLPYTALMHGLNHSQDFKRENSVKNPPNKYFPLLNQHYQQKKRSAHLSCLYQHEHVWRSTPVTWLKPDWFQKPQQAQTVGLNPLQFPNLFCSAATQTPTLVQAGRRKLLPPSAELAASENQTEDLLLFAGSLTKASKAKLPLKNRGEAKFRISMRCNIASYKLTDELWVLSQMTISLDTALCCWKQNQFTSQQ